MSFLENNAKQIAAILCTLSAFPVVSTVFAMEGNTGFAAEKQLETAADENEINNDTYYVEENARTASVHNTFADNLKSQVSETYTLVEAEAQAEAEAEEAAVEEEVIAVAEEEAAPMMLMEAAPVAEEAPAAAEAPVYEEAPAVMEQAPIMEAAPVVEEAPVIVEAPVYEEAPAVVEQAPAPEVSAPVEAAPAPEVSAPVEQAPVEAAPAPAPEVAAPAYDAQAALNQNIANAAIGMVGVTNGWQCTEVATGALNAAGYPAGVVWPDQYLQYGTVVTNPTAGNLIYYDNGGRGLDHIAVYIGNGQAVHGNFDGQTVIAGAELPTLAPPIYIQVG